MSYFRPNHRDQGMTDQQWRVLRVLSQSSMEVTELARHAALLYPSVSRILGNFETSGLIERCTVEADLRRSLVQITPKGINRLAAGAEEVNSAYDEIIRRFGRQRMDQLLKLLGELEDALAKPAVEASALRGENSPTPRLTSGKGSRKGGRVSRRAV